MRKLSILLTPYQPKAYFVLFYTNNIHWSLPMETLKSEQSGQRSWKGHRHWLPTMMSQNWWGSLQCYCGAQTTHEKQYNATFLWLERAAAAVSPAVLTSKFFLSLPACSRRMKRNTKGKHLLFTEHSNLIWIINAQAIEVKSIFPIKEQ